MEWIIPNLLPVGLTLLSGPPKTGKSFISLDLSFAVAAGGLALGSLECDPGKSAIYVALEDHMARIDDRLKMLEPDEEAWPWDSLSVMTQEDHQVPLAPFLDAWYAETAADGLTPSLVTIDTLGTYRSLMAAAGRGPRQGSAYDQDVRLLQPLQTWALEHRVAMVVVHHTNQTKWEDGEDWTGKVSGTSGLTGTADQTMVLKGERGQPEAELLLVGREMPDSNYSLFRTGAFWQITAGVKMTDMGGRKRAIVEYVLEKGEPVTVAEVAEFASLDEKMTATYLGRAVQSGHLARAGRGMYGPPVADE